MSRLNIKWATGLLWLMLSGGIMAADYERVFSIQLGAYRSTDAREDLIRKYQNYPLYCRQNSRKAYVVYYGVFESFKDARPHLQDLPEQDKLGAYIVKLNNVNLKPCINLSEKINGLI